MDYALEYALMSDIFDNMTRSRADDSYGEYLPAREGEFKDYVNQYKDKGFGAKVGAGFRFILNKAYELLQKLIAFIPTLIVQFKARKEGRDMNGVTSKYFAVKIEIERRMTMIGKDINTILGKTNKDLGNLNHAIEGKDYHGISVINDSLDKSAEDIQDKVNFAHKYVAESVRNLIKKAGSDGTGTRGYANELMQEAITGLGIDKMLEENLNALKKTQAEVKKIRDTASTNGFVNMETREVIKNPENDANLAAGTMRCVKCIDKILNAVAKFGAIGTKDNE